MKYCDYENIRYLQFDLLQNCPGISHASFLRHGGESQGPFASLNASNEVGDNALFVAENRKKISAALNLPKLLDAVQTHNIELFVHTSADVDIPPCDALITKIPAVGLMIKHADCQATMLYDPIQHVIANVHAGWRGSVKQVYTKTIERLKKEFGCKPENLLVCISPSLGPEKAEFINYKTELPEPFWDFQIKPFHFDFWKISEEELKSARVLPHHIEIAGICTYMESKDFFSYRREKTTGRMASVIGLR